MPMSSSEICTLSSSHTQFVGCGVNARAELCNPPRYNHLVIFGHHFSAERGAVQITPTHWTFEL